MVDLLTTSAISWGFSAASWLISPVLSRFLNQCFEALAVGSDLPPQFQSRKQTLLENLDKLQTTLLPKLLILTDAAQQSPHRLFLEKWIQKLKSTFYEAEHVLGLVEYDRLEKKVGSLFPPKSTFNLKKVTKEKHPKLSPQQNNLIESLKNFEKVVNEAMEFVSLLNLPSTTASNSTWRTNKQYRETISTPSSEVIGRDKDRDNIVSLLKEDFAKSSRHVKPYSVIAIWGMGGSGKTTLAQFVYKHVKEKMCFDHLMWVHVSESFKIRDIMKKMWETLTGRNCPDYQNLDVLISQLGENLKEKKFLLVLDDVWCDKGVSEQELDHLFIPLNCGKQGSKILVTTRNEDAARNLGARDLIELPELAYDDFLSLFMTHALFDIKVNKHMEKRLREIGVKIAQKLCRSPLAAITVARQLNRRLDPDFWLSMLHKRFLTDVMGALYMSYQHLDPTLQRCFAFCNLFPKGHSFTRDNLINLWIAEGFIEAEHSNEHMKVIANQYFLELISSSFIQVDKMYTNHHYYYMHDLIHDLAQLVSQGECFQIGSGEKKEIPIQTRHLHVVTDMLGEYVKQICKLNDLCTIVVRRTSSVPNLKEVDLDVLFVNLRKLYVVELPHIESLPKSVTHLKNLRYLKIDQADAIPEFLNILYQLRSLFWGSTQIEIPNVGRLILLQDMHRFDVRKEKGFDIKQLEHLADIFGSLSIYGLHHVDGKEEAIKAKLSEKQGLQNLRFYWDHESEDVIRDKDVEILDSLCPPPQIKELVINGYNGKRLPRWILENNDNLLHLKHLKLTECSGLEGLHRLNELFNLLSLTIYSLPRLKNWATLPLNLTQLEISHCFSLAFVLKEDLEMITLVKSKQISQIVAFSNNCSHNYYNISVDCHFSRVQEMIKLDNYIDEQELSKISKNLKGCLEKRLDLICQLKEIYRELYLPHALEKLIIKSCIITDRVLAGSLKGLSSLTHLILWDIITITCIADEVLASLTSLMLLQIKGCMLLTSISGWDTNNTLEELWIYCCPNLTLKASIVANNSNTVEQALPSCKRKTTSSVLNFVYLAACMPSDNSFENLVCAEMLTIRDCPTIVNPHISSLKSLIRLDFYDCSNLISLRGLSELNSLEELNMIGCQKFEYYSDADKMLWLKRISINRLSQLEQLIPRDGYSFLVSLELSYAEEEYFSPQECEVFCYLSSLEIIRFCHCKIRELPNLSSLSSLRYVYISFCENVTSLPELPPSVQCISIRDCNEDFTKSCRDPEDQNWQKLSHIPKKIYDS